MGLTGVLLLISGLAYTFIGIKNKWFVLQSCFGNGLTQLRLYVFFSAAYLTSLAVTVSMFQLQRRMID